MGHIEIESWEILLHVSVIILLCVTVLCLIKERVNRNRSIMKVDNKRNFGSFGDEILSQLIRQQAERALETIYDTVEREQRFLQDLIKKGNIAREDRTTFQETGNQTPMQFYKEGGEDPVRGTSASGPIPFKEVERLADLGVSAEDLAESAGIPKGEMLLMEKLERYAHDTEHENIRRDRASL